jgi:hypothetical protein
MIYWVSNDIVPQDIHSLVLDKLEIDLTTDDGRNEVLSILSTYEQESLKPIEFVDTHEYKLFNSFTGKIKRVDADVLEGFNATIMTK